MPADTTPMVVHDPAHVDLGTCAKYPTWEGVPPLPNESLLAVVGAPHYENFYLVGETWAHIVSRYLKPGATLLDIGCGCARTARFLLLRGDVRYVGFDVFLPAIEWSRRYIQPLAGGRFRFEHLDVHSGHYNPRGAVGATAARFPAEDGSMDVAIAASLFTHLLEPQAQHYLAESRRALKRGGLLIASIHDEPAQGQVFSGRENRIDIREDYFRKMAERAGLQFTEHLGLVCGQQTLCFRTR